MILAVFDIDGTLTNTTQVDGECYPYAWELEFGVKITNRNINDYEHVTHSGITRDLFRQEFDRLPEPREIQTLIDRYMGLLEETYKIRPHLFNEIAGAGRLIRLLSESADFAIALATGSWGDPTVFKLERADIEYGGLPLATADDAIAREDIVRQSIDQAKARYGVSQFSKVVSVGDGLWDVRTAALMGMPFIGVGDPKRLSAQGALHTVRDFSSPRDFIELIEKAETPRVPTPEG